jgi:hypothetical protein
MEFKRRTLSELADMICGNYDGSRTLFRYRSSNFLTEFFYDCDTDYTHDGTTRSSWVCGRLYDILPEPHLDARTPPETFCRVIRVLMDKEDATPADDADRKKAYTPRSSAKDSRRSTARTMPATCGISGPTPSRSRRPIRTAI